MAIKKLLTQYKAYSAKIKLNDKEKKAIGDDYVIEHTSFFYLIDKKTGNLIKPVASNKDSMEIDLQEYKR